MFNRKEQGAPGLAEGDRSPMRDNRVFLATMAVLIGVALALILAVIFVTIYR